MKWDNKDLMEEFFTLQKEKNPQIDLTTMKAICSSPWSYLKIQMETGTLSEVRLKYFGTFQVYIGRAKHLLLKLEIRYKFNKIDRKSYLERKEILTKYIKMKENGKTNS